MKNSRKMKKWGCVMLALMSGLMLPGIVQANSGLIDTPQIIDEENYYVGIKGASGNEVIIDRDLDAGAIGGYAYSYLGDVESKNNSVAVSASTVAYDIYSGYAYSVQGNATANRNSVTVNGGTVGNETEGVNIFGGNAYSDSGSAEANRNSVTVDVDIFGSGEDNGSVSISGGHAYSVQGDATANKNSVTISGGTVNTEDNKNIYISGGNAYSDSGRAEAKNNTVTISGGSITGGICGGCVTTGKAADNIVNITGGTISSIKIPAGPGINVPSGSISGGTASGAGSFVTGNRVNISGETILEGFYEMGFIAGGDASGTGSTVTGNSVAVSSGTIESAIYGGYNYGSGGTVADNNMIISGGTFSFANIGGGLAAGANNIVAGNNVTISGGTITNSVIRGGRVRGTGSTAAGNSVTISGGTVTGEVYGGYVEGNTDSTAAGNSIALSGTADVSGVDLYGSNLSASGTNNNLVINGWSGAVKSLNNFDQIQVKALAGGLDLAAGKRTVFVNTAEGISDSSLNPTEAKEMQAGVALTVSGNMGISENKDIYIDVTGVRASDQTVIAVESRAASVAAVGRGSEAVTDSLDTLRGRGEGLSTFASIIGSRSRYNTGSHADVNGWNGIVGTAWTRELTSGTLSCGAFYENGGGSYDTYNTINGRTYRGDGDTVYNGGGLLLRWETNGGTYTEASLRAGMVKNEVGPSLEFAGNRYGFKTENNYYGGHVGIGRIMERDDGDAWDIYGKYFHMHHEGDTVTIAGDEFAFDSVNSDRLRVGARYLDRKNDRFTGYYGLAYEYEFSGDTGGTANHHAMYTPSLQGSTVIGEIGFRGTPGEESPWSFEVSLRGYAGKQEGISGAVTAAYSF